MKKETKNKKESFSPRTQKNMDAGLEMNNCQNRGRKNKNLHTFMGVGVNKKLVFSLAVFAVALFVFWGGAHDANAGLGSYIGDKIIGGAATMVKDTAGAALAAVFNMLLFVVFMFMGFLLIIAGSIFDWAINPANFSAVMSLGAVKSGWVMVRDFLNIGFILALLYSAFCTVFQVQSFNTKKIILTLVIMALLVNFSFPIARFIIDVGNVTMYYLLNIKFGDLGNSTGLATSIAQFTKITDMMGQGPIRTSNGVFEGETTIKMLASIIFLFLLASTLLILGILFVIRILVLAIVVIFSPIGFVGQAFPGTNKFSGMWWDALFKQTFFGVVMAFMIVISMNMMEQIGSDGGIFKQIQQQKISELGTVNTGDYSMIIVVGTYMAIPITLLWIGMIAAQKIGAYGAAKVQGYANKGMKWAAMAPLKYSGIQGGVKQAADYYKKKGVKIPFTNTRMFGSDQLEDKEARIKGLLTGGKAGFTAGAKNAQRKRIAEQQEEYKKLNLSESEAHNKLTSSSSSDTEKAAAALYLSEKDKITKYDRYKDAMDALSFDSELQDKITDKVKKDNNISIIVDYDINVRGKTRSDAYKENLDKMAPKKLAEQKNLHNRINTADPDYDPEFAAYVNNRKTADPAFIRNVARDMNGVDRNHWRGAGIIP